MKDIRSLKGDRDVTVLVIEDDVSISEIICTRLAKEGYQTVPAFSGTEAKMLLSAPDAQAFDVVVTDLMLPGMAGDELVALIRRANADIPIIVVSARTSPKDKVDLLTIGADDYLSKPFDLEELTARVNVQLRKAAVRLAGEAGDQAAAGALAAVSAGVSVASADVTLGCLSVDPVQRRAMVSGAEIVLTRTEFDMLHALMRHPKRVFTKQELYEQVWNEPYPGQENSVNAHISNLRSKLKGTDADGYIQTVWGIGFKFDCDV